MFSAVRRALLCGNVRDRMHCWDAAWGRARITCALKRSRATGVFIKFRHLDWKIHNFISGNRYMGLKKCEML